MSFRRSAPAIAAAVGAAVVAIHNYTIAPWILDDAFITFRYAENFAAGHGLVFNVGERVEGYTTFIWVLLLALAKKVGFDTVTVAQVLGFVFSFCCLIVVAFAYRFSSEISRRDSAIAALLLGTCGVFTPWARSGLEVTLFASMVTLTMLLYFPARAATNPGKALIAVGAMSAVTTLVRPEGLLVFAVIFLDQLLAGFLKKSKGVLVFGLSYLLLYSPFFIWRLLYYGYPLPNTFYAKVGSTTDQIARGLDYFWGFLVPAALILLPVIAAVVLRKFFSKLSALNILLFAILAFAVYTIAVGGDCMPAYRFFTPVMALLCLLAAVSLRLVTKQSTLRGIFVVAVIAYNLVQLRFDEQIYDHIRKDQVVFKGRKAGAWLAANAPANAVIATNTSGSVPYYSKLKTIDMLGLNDVHIAHRQIPSMGTGRAGHEKGDGDYVLSRRPEFIQFGGALGASSPAFLSDKELYDNPRFREQYSLQGFRLPDGAGLILYVRNDLLQRPNGATQQ